MRLGRYLLLVVALTITTKFAFGQTGDRYSGDYYLYARVEHHSSNGGGTVSLLKPTGFDYFDPSWLPPAILIDGPLVRETIGVVRRLLEGNPRARTLFLNSPGGELAAGLDLGTLAHSRGLQMIVNAGAACHSACALAFLGGKHRLVLTSPDQFSFHRQYYLVEGRQVYANWEKDVSRISDYLQAIEVTSIKAPEIVGTTGQASFTDARLLERGITTRSALEHHQFVLLTIKPATIYENFRVACHALDKTVLCESTPLLREPAIRKYAILSKALGSFKDLDRASRGLFELAVQFKDASPETIFSIDCQFGGEGFFDNIEARLIEVKASTRAEGALPYEQRRNELRQKCNALRQIR